MRICLETAGEENDFSRECGGWKDHSLSQVRKEGLYGAGERWGAGEKEGGREVDLKGDTPNPGPVWRLSKEEMNGEQYRPTREELEERKQRLKEELEMLLAE